MSNQPNAYLPQYHSNNVVEAIYFLLLLDPHKLCVVSVRPQHKCSSLTKEMSCAYEDHTSTSTVA
jgi:hypothetical protein